jgi:hypothetical protein
LVAETLLLTQPVRPSNSGTSQQGRNVKRCKRYAEAFQLSRAVEAFTSNGVASPCADVVDELKMKHPIADLP